MSYDAVRPDHSWELIDTTNGATKVFFRAAAWMEVTILAGPPSLGSKFFEGFSLPVQWIELEANSLQRADQAMHHVAVLCWMFCKFSGGR